MTDSTPLHIQDRSANPAPLGLFGFGFTTILLNMANAGLIPLDSMIFAMGICYGGLAQVLAGYLEAKKGNTFGLTAFGSYGFFWLSLVALLVLPKLGWAPAPASATMTAYLALWGVFTLLLFFGTFKLSRALQVVFATLTVLFALLAWAECSGNPAIKTLAGCEGMLCGASAVYTGIAQLLNEVYGKDLLPLGRV